MNKTNDNKQQKLNKSEGRSNPLETIVSPQYWSVDIKIDGKCILIIESNMLSGVNDIEKYKQTIKEIAHNILAFIGESG